MEPNDAVDPVLQNELQSEYSAMIDDVLHTLDGTYGVQNSNIADTMYNPPSVSSVSSTSSSPTFTNLTQPNTTNLEGVRLRIVEEPAPKGLRFRYICEGRSAGSIPGIHSTPENKTFPTIEIEGYEGTVKIVVSCVTKDEPYRPHPHNLVGKENCEHGVCTMRLNGPPMRAVFSNLGIQCVKKKDIRAALEERERKRIDPFKTKFAHKDKPSEIDLNVVRLCFQAFIPIPGPQKYYKIPPVVSEPIYDKKSINDLVICRLCSCSAKVTGGAEIFLLCEKVPKDDIKIRFYEEKNNELYWEEYAEFQQTDVHKQTAIAFKTPRYINPDINRKVQVYIQLYRPSDGEKSEPLPFEFYPDPDNIKRKRLRTGGHPINMFQEIQQFDQNQMQYNNVNSTNVDFWNVQAPTPSTSATAATVAEIKPEPYLSPIYYGGTYRNTYQASPSPQPLSPMMNRNINTPSPNGLMRNSSAESQTQMSFAYNQSQMNITESQYQNVSNNFHMSPNNPFRESSNNPNQNISNSNMLSPPLTQFATFNPAFNRTSGGSITPIYANDNSNNDNNANNSLLNTPEFPSMKSVTNNTNIPTLQGSPQNNVNLNQFQASNTATALSNSNNNTTQFQALNVPNNLLQGQNFQGTAPNFNVMLNQFQDTNVATVSAEGFLNNLLLIDNNDFVDVNSDELRNLSNLSIST